MLDLARKSLNVIDQIEIDVIVDADRNLTKLVVEYDLVREGIDLATGQF
jgi:hypothetical protein